MHRLEVGGLFFPNQTKIQEGAYLEYTESGPMLLLAVGNPSAKEVEAARGGPLRFALYETDVLLWFLYHIEGFGSWSDCPFSIRLYDGQGKRFDWSEEIVEGTGLALSIVLVDAHTGIVKTLRLVALPTVFSREFRVAILRQLERPFSAEAYYRHIDQTYRMYSTDALVQRAQFRS